MNKSFVAAFALAVFVVPGVSLAYELPSPVSTVGGETISLGAGEATLSKRSVIEGTFTLDKVNREDAYLTVGDVANQESGYGFFMHENMVYAVTHTGSFEYRMPLAFLTPGNPVTFRAEYIPGFGIKLDTAAYMQYSRGVVLDFYPNFLARTSALNVHIKSNDGTRLDVGAFSYKD